MDDLIEFFEDFNKKFLVLIKHLIVRPKLVFESLLNKDKVYTRPFKFYSVVSSFTLFLVLLSNRFNLLSFWNDKYVLPKYWSDYFNNINEISLTLLPILGFLFFITLLSLFSLVLFRKPKKNILFHFSYAMYIVGIIILYLDLFMLPLSLVVNQVSINSNLLYIISFVFFAIPMAYIGYAYWIWFGTKILKAIKILILMAGTTYLYATIYFDGHLEEIINNQMFYSKDARDEIKSDLVFSNKIYAEKDWRFLYLEFNSFYDFKPLLATVSTSVDSINIDRIDNDTMTFVNHLVSPNTLSVNLFNYSSNPIYAITKSNETDSSSQINHLWRITEDSVNLIVSDTLLFDVYSKIVPQKENLILTGQNRKKQASIYSILEEGIEPLYSLDDSVTYIEDLIPLSKEQDDFLFLSSKLNENSLESVTIHHIQLGDSVILNKTRLFQNTFAYIPHHFDYHLSDFTYIKKNICTPKLIMSKDSSEIYVLFQIMTEKTFELQMFTLDRALNIISQSNYTTNYNLTYFDDYVLEEDNLYLVGRVYSIVAKGISTFGENSGRSFIAKFNTRDWTLDKMKIIERKDWFDDLSLYAPDIHLKIGQDSLQVYSFGSSLEKWSIEKF